MDSPHIDEEPIGTFEWGLSLIEGGLRKRCVNPVARHAQFTAWGKASACCGESVDLRLRA